MLITGLLIVLCISNIVVLVFNIKNFLRVYREYKERKAAFEKEFPL